MQFPQDSSVPFPPNTIPTVQPIPKDAEEYNLYVTDFPDSPVVGLGADTNWLYIARRNQTDITLERFGRGDKRLYCQTTTRLENVPEPASNATDALAYNLKIHNNQVLLVPRQTLVDDTTSGGSQPQALRVEIPQYGGCAQWQTQPVYGVNFTQPSQPIDPTAMTACVTIPTSSDAMGCGDMIGNITPTPTPTLGGALSSVVMPSLTNMAFSETITSGDVMGTLSPTPSVNATQHPGSNNALPVALGVAVPVVAAGVATGIAAGALTYKYRKQLKKLLRARKKAWKPEESEGMEFDSAQQKVQSIQTTL